MKKKPTNTDKLIPFLSVGSVFALWFLYVVIFDVPSYLLPNPVDVFRALYENRALLWMHAKYTLLEAILGLSLSVILSYLFAILMDLYRPIKKFLHPLFIISQTIPLMAIAPLLIIWVGMGIDAKILLVTLVCVFPITVNVLTGLEEVDEEYISLFQVMRASKFELYRHLKIPHSLPYFFSGLKISATYAILGALIAEWMGADFGLGIYLSRSMSSFDKVMAFANIVVIVITTLALIGLIQIIKYRILSYRRVNNEKIS